jgi:hypothetical protein
VAPEQDAALLSLPNSQVRGVPVVVRDTEGHVFASTIRAFVDIEDVQHTIQRLHDTNLATPYRKWPVSLFVSSGRTIFAEPCLLSTFTTKGATSSRRR